MNRRSERLAGVLLCIHNRASGFRTNSKGEFWRVLLPGTYTLLVSEPDNDRQASEARSCSLLFQISAEGYLPTSVDFQVRKNKMTTVEVKLYTGYFYEE